MWLHASQDQHHQYTFLLYLEETFHEMICIDFFLFFLFSIPAQVQIVHKKIDLSNVKSKCGSTANIHHKPGRS